MKEKILKYLETLSFKVPSIKGNRYITFVICFFTLIVFILFTMFVGGWLFNCRASNKADLDVLIKVLTIFCDPGFAALLLLVLKLGVDTNNNNTPDILEKENHNGNN